MVAITLVMTYNQGLTLCFFALCNLVAILPPHIRIVSRVQAVLHKWKQESLSLRP